jgi:hypothetical protein
MIRLAYALSLAMLAAACDSAVPPTQPDSATRTETAEKTAVIASSGSDTPFPRIRVRYSCDQGHRVDIFDAGSARVTLADGRIVDIPRVAGSAPPRYAGIALSFEVGSEGAILGQDETGGFACRQAG